MKKKKISKKKILICSIIGITIAGIIGFVVENNIDKNKSNSSTSNNNKKKTCENIDGGSFSIIFNTNNPSIIDKMNICVSCSPDTYKDLPVPSYEGYTFDGWFYDKELTKKVEESNSSKIIPVQKKDKENCVIGYEDINLYAKWNKVEEVQEEQNDFNELDDLVEEELIEPEEIPELDISEEITDEINNNPSEQELITTTSFRRPTNYGKYYFENDYIVAPIRGPIFSISNGRVVYKGTSNLSQSYNTPIFQIVILTIYNNSPLYITYQVTEPRVGVGDFVTDDTRIGSLFSEYLYLKISDPVNTQRKIRLGSLIPVAPEWTER